MNRIDAAPRLVAIVTQRIWRYIAVSPRIDKDCRHPSGKSVRAEGALMQSKPLLRHILNEDALTRGLGDEEARVLVEWLVDWAELLAVESDTEQEAWAGVRTLCRRARGISHFVRLWSEAPSRAAAIQLAAVERFCWPLPFEEEDPAELMVRVLAWEDRMIQV